MKNNNVKKLKEELPSVLDRDNDKRECNYNGVKSIIESIPAGAGLSYFYQKYVSSPATERLNQFLTSLVEAISELDEKFDNVDLDSPQFSTALMFSLQIASRNHQKEKLDALKNAVLNSALLDSLEEDKQTMFLNWIDELTPSHLKALDIIHNLSKYAKNEILPYLNNHLEYIKKNKGDNRDIEYKVPILGELSKNHDFYHQIIKDLEDKGLVNFDKSRTQSRFSKNLGFKARQMRLPQSQNSFDDRQLQELLKNMVDIQKDVANFIDHSKLANIDYIQLLHESVYVAGICTIYTPPPESIESRVTSIGELFLQFIHSPLE